MIITHLWYVPFSTTSSPCKIVRTKLIPVAPLALNKARATIGNRVPGRTKEVWGQGFFQPDLDFGTSGVQKEAYNPTHLECLKIPKLNYLAAAFPSYREKGEPPSSIPTSSMF